MAYEKELRIRKRMCEKIIAARADLIRKGLTKEQAEMLTERDLRDVEIDFIDRKIKEVL